MIQKGGNSSEIVEMAKIIIKIKPDLKLLARHVIYRNEYSLYEVNGFPPLMIYGYKSDLK